MSQEQDPTWEELSKVMGKAREDESKLAAAEAAELTKIRALSPEDREALERDFWNRIGPTLRDAQPDIKLPYDD